MYSVTEVVLEVERLYFPGLGSSLYCSDLTWLWVFLFVLLWGSWNRKRDFPKGDKSWKKSIVIKRDMYMKCCGWSLCILEWYNGIKLHIWDPGVRGWRSGESKVTFCRVRKEEDGVTLKFLCPRNKEYIRREQILVFLVPKIEMLKCKLNHSTYCHKDNDLCQLKCFFNISDSRCSLLRVLKQF